MSIAGDVVAFYASPFQFERGDLVDINGEEHQIDEAQGGFYRAVRTRNARRAHTLKLRRLARQYERERLWTACLGAIDP